MKGKTLFIVIVIALVAVAGGYYLLKHRGTQQVQEQSGPMPVPAGRCVIRDVTDAYEFTGTTEAVDAVEIRARVEGYLQGIHFTDGQIVEKGQLLFTIEPEAFAARRDAAAAQLKAAQAEMEQARVDLERIEKAVKTNAVSQQDLTRSRAAYDMAAAAVLAAQADLENAELDLSYTEIRSPLRGRISRHLADIGNLVGPSSQPVLTTVLRTQPIYVYFYISESLLKGELTERLRGEQDAEPMRFQVGLSDENDYPHEGVLCFLDNTVDPRTGTVYVRGQLANETETLLPGMFVRVRVPTEERPDAVLIPEKAVMTDLGGKYVLVVGENNILQRRDVTLGATTDQLRVVLSGLDGSELFAMGSFHIIRPGMPITPITGQSPPQATGAEEAVNPSKNP